MRLPDAASVASRICCLLFPAERVKSEKSPLDPSLLPSQFWFLTIEFKGKRKKLARFCTGRGRTLHSQHVGTARDLQFTTNSGEFHLRTAGHTPIGQLTYTLKNSSDYWRLWLNLVKFEEPLLGCSCGRGSVSQGVGRRPGSHKPRLPSSGYMTPEPFLSIDTNAANWATALSLVVLTPLGELVVKSFLFLKILFCFGKNTYYC